MQVGVFSDVHGDLPALLAVWDTLQARGLTDGPILNAGDSVGYGQQPDECVQFLRERPNILTVQGNYDKNVARFPERAEEYARKWGRSRPAKYEALRDGSLALSEASRAWLLHLPAELSLTLAGIPILLTHYAPAVKEGLGSWTPDSRLRELAACTDARVVVCGHTHTPFVREAGGVLFVNPGTVGRPLWGKPAFAVLMLEPDAPPAAQLASL